MKKSVLDLPTRYNKTSGLEIDKVDWLKADNRSQVVTS